MKNKFVQKFLLTTLFTLGVFGISANYFSNSYAEHTDTHCNDLYGADPVSYNTCIANLPAAGNNEISIGAPDGAITSISKVISGSVNLIIIIAGLIAFIYLLLGGIKWITSGGDPGQVEAARNQIIQALVGIIVVLAAWALIMLIQSATGANFGLGQEMNLDTLFRP